MKILLLTKIFFLTTSIAIFPGMAGAEPIHQWEVFSISFKSLHAYSNPYKKITVIQGGALLKVTFRGTAGEALNKHIPVTGFWNGG